MGLIHELEQHTSKRLRERYDLNYKNSLRKSLIEKIQAGEAVFMWRTSNSRTVFDVKHDVRRWEMCNTTLPVPGEVTIRVVYDSKLKTIVTVLPIWPH